MTNANKGNWAIFEDEPFPHWVIRYVIAILQYAKLHDLPKFETQIGQGTEVILVKVTASNIAAKDTHYSRMISLL